MNLQFRLISNRWKNTRIDMQIQMKISAIRVIPWVGLVKLSTSDIDLIVQFFLNLA